MIYPTFVISNRTLANVRLVYTEFNQRRTKRFVSRNEIRLRMLVNLLNNLDQISYHVVCFFTNMDFLHPFSVIILVFSGYIFAKDYDAGVISLPESNQSTKGDPFNANKIFNNIIKL